MGLISRVSSRTYRNFLVEKSTHFYFELAVKMASHHAIPIKILHEAEGHIITVETSTGEIYRGKLQDAEDNMNIQMQNVTMTHRSGNTEQLQKIYIRGSQVRFMILPDMLKSAPMLNQSKAAASSRGLGRGGQGFGMGGGAPAGRARGGPPGRGGFGRGKEKHHQ